MDLFDDIERDVLPITEYHPSFRALNQFDWPGAECTRSHLESWFQRYPPSAQARLRGRFRSEDDREHEGALFELFLHELFSHLDCSLEVDPKIADGNKTPDFLVERHDRRFYLEATVVADHLGPFTLSPNERDVMEKLNALDSEHFDIRIDTKGTLSRTLGRAQSRSAIRAAAGRSRARVCTAAHCKTRTVGGTGCENRKWQLALGGTARSENPGAPEESGHQTNRQRVLACQIHRQCSAGSHGATKEGQAVSFT